MRVLMVLFKDIHYDARVQREAIALARAGWYVDIACLNILPDPPPELHDRVRLLRFPVHTKRIKHYVDQKTNRSIQKGVYRVVRTPMVQIAKDAMTRKHFATQLWELCEHACYDVVHCHDVHALGIGVHLKRKKGLTLIYDAHGLFDEKNEKRWEQARDHRAESRWMDSVDHLITVNELLEAEYNERYPAISTTVLRNIPESLPRLPSEKNYFHQRFGLHSEDRVVLYQGRFTPNRGLEELIEAFVPLPSQHKLVLLGYGEWEEQILRRIKDRKLQDRIFFHPPLLPRKLLQVTSHADLGAVLYQNTCMTSHLSTPTNLMEYIQAGLPVVCSDHPGKAIVVGTYETGRLVNPQNITEISGAIREILSNPDTYLIGTHKARKLLQWGKEQERLVELYRQLHLSRGERPEKEQEEEDIISIQPHLRQL